MINEFFDRVFLINLDDRKDRLDIADCLLKEHHISYERFPAIKDDNGIKGLVLTMKALFKLCLGKNYHRVLIFEDDVEFLHPNISAFMQEIQPQIPDDFYTFHLGLNLLTRPERISMNVLRVNQSYSTHAIAYQRESIKLIYDTLSTETIIPYDIYLRDVIQVHNRSYATMPMIATQRTNFSDIEKKDTDWRTLMSMTFATHTRGLQSFGELAFCIGEHKIAGIIPQVNSTKFEIQHPEMLGIACDCKRMIYHEEACGCTMNEWKVKWQDNPNR